MNLEERAEHLAQMMREKLGIPGKDLIEKHARSERMLPAHVRDKVEIVARALELSRHPKLSRQIDMKPVEIAAQDVEKYLDAINPWARRWRLLVDHLADAAIGILVMFALIFLVLRWRGYF